MGNFLNVKQQSYSRDYTDPVNITPEEILMIDEDGNLLAYNPYTNSSKFLPSISSYTGGSLAVCLIYNYYSGKLYICTYGTGSTTFYYVNELTITTNPFSFVSNHNIGLFGRGVRYGCAYSSGSLLVVFSTDLNKVYKFNIGTEDWTLFATLPSGYTANRNISYNASTDTYIVHAQSGVTYKMYYYNSSGTLLATKNFGNSSDAIITFISCSTGDNILYLTRPLVLVTDGIKDRSVSLYRESPTNTFVFTNISPHASLGDVDMLTITTLYPAYDYVDPPKDF